MTSLRAFRPADLFNTNLTNLDPLTENYNIDFYFEYLIQWPSLFTVVEDQYGNITGYSELRSTFFPLARLLSIHTILPPLGLHNSVTPSSTDEFLIP